jgi:hypothetical protein
MQARRVGVIFPSGYPDIERVSVGMSVARVMRRGRKVVEDSMAGNEWRDMAQTWRGYISLSFYLFIYSWGDSIYIFPAWG